MESAVVSENVSVDRYQVYKKKTVQFALSKLVVFSFEFYISLTRLLSENGENNLK